MTSRSSAVNASPSSTSDDPATASAPSSARRCPPTNPSAPVIRIGPRIRGSLVSAAPGDDGRHGAGQDRDVEPERPVLEVVEVEPHEVVEAEIGTAGDLPEPGQARENEVALEVPALELLVVAQRQRSRPDEAHLAPEHVPDLRDLVQREAAENRPDRGHARVLADLEEGPVRLVRRFELGLAPSCAGVHRAELVHPELALAQPDAGVAVE